MLAGAAYKRPRPGIFEFNTDNHSAFCVAPLAPPPPAGALYPEPTGFLGVISTICSTSITHFKEATGDLKEANQVAKLSSSSGKSHYIVNG
jgi:hypothetical protein